MFYSERSSGVSLISHLMLLQVIKQIFSNFVSVFCCAKLLFVIMRGCTELSGRIFPHIRWVHYYSSISSYQCLQQNIEIENQLVLSKYQVLVVVGVDKKDKFKCTFSSRVVIIFLHFLT